MAVGDIITAARYNIIQARVAAVIGLGSGDEGYGQARTSSTVAVGATITAQDMQNLFTDMTKIRLHQTGSVPAEIAVPRNLCAELVTPLAALVVFLSVSP